MFRLKEGQSLRLQIVVYTAGLLLLTQNSAGQYEVLSSPQQIFTLTDNDIILPCHLEPSVDAVSMAVEWTRPDLYPRFVHVRRGGQDLLVDQNPKYEGRTSLSINKLKLGDVSLKLSKVKLSDAGTYKCFIPGINKHSVVHLVVGAVSVPVIVSIDGSSSGLVLQCESEGWYPEPEVLWLDSAGNLLSAGPTETLTGPDGLFTVSSRLNVDKRHSNVFTCRVQQKNIEQTRETGIKIQGDVFVAPSGSVAPIIVVSVISFLLLSVVFFLLWRRRQNRGNDKVHHDKETQKGKEEEELDRELQEKEEEKKDNQDVILILEEQKTDLEISRAKLKSKLEEVEEEWRENEKKLQKVKNSFNWDKEVSERSLFKLKMELEKKETECKKSLDSIEKKLQKLSGMLPKMEDRKKKVENQIDEVKKALNEANMQKVEREKGESKMKLQNVKESFHSNKPDETNPRSEIKIEMEQTEHLKLLDSTEENIQDSMVMISVMGEQKKEPESTRAEQKSKQKKVEKEKGEIKMKLQKVKKQFQGRKTENKTTLLSEIKIEPEDENREHKKPLDSTEENIQGSMDMTSIREEHKTEPESTRAEQKSKQKNVEEEKGESKKKIEKVKESSHLNNPEQKGTNMQQDEVQERVQSEQADREEETPQQTDSIRGRESHFA